MRLCEQLPADAIIVDEGLTSAASLNAWYPVPRPLRLFRQHQRRHRLGHRGGGRRAARPALAPGGRDPRRRQRHVQHPGAVERCQPEAAGDLRDLQQWRLPDPQAAPEGVPRRRAVHRHGFSATPRSTSRAWPDRSACGRTGSRTAPRSMRCSARRSPAPSPCCWTWWSTGVRRLCCMRRAGASDWPPVKPDDKKSGRWVKIL